MKESEKIKDKENKEEKEDEDQEKPVIGKTISKKLKLMLNYF